MALLWRTLHRAQVPHNHLPGKSKCIIAFINDMHPAEAHQLMYRVQGVLEDVVHLDTMK